MVSRKTIRGCFGTKELSLKSKICKTCKDYSLCQIVYKKNKEKRKNELGKIQRIKKRVKRRI